MNGHTENKKNTYPHLDRLSTEPLEELLCADIKSPDDDHDAKRRRIAFDRGPPHPYGIIIAPSMKKPQNRIAFTVLASCKSDSLHPLRHDHTDLGIHI